MKKILAGILACVLALGMLCACGGSGKDTNGDGETGKRLPSGSFYTLKEAYANGWLTREDLMEITYRGSGEVLLLTVPESELPNGWNGNPEAYFQKIDYTSPYPDPVLDKDTEKAIIHSYQAKYFSKYNGNDDDFTVVFYGEFHGSYVCDICGKDINRGGGVWYEAIGDVVYLVGGEPGQSFEVFRFDQE